jgi:hypothetical protein
MRSQRALFIAVDRRTGSATICAGAILQSECRGNQSDQERQEDGMTGRRRGVIAAVAVLVASAVTAGALGRSTTGQTSNTSRAGAPRFEVDTSWQWPPALPNNWVVGVVSGVAVDRRDHV